ncbi:glycosyltransferase family 2 protein [Lactobacillus reuteri]|nr:glycosyltransferase family 2 protein [Limosilactobacillus reuteri]MQB86954.1 glycosyltransferase family 2 protein [Limosilactobacillus reuteri]
MIEEKSMSNENVAILMSTYNGEKYLEEQVKSIISQDYTDWHLYIRDDGSTDNTVSLIKKITRDNEKITFLNENKPKNLGVTGSFMDLLANTKAQYYMFSDQDDYWMEDKISAALKKMQASEIGDMPICVHSNLTVVDTNLHGDSLMNSSEEHWSDFKSMLFANCVTGCTMMINQELKNLIDFNKVKSNKLYVHDWWIALVAAAFGKVVYLDRSTILYRQHQGNVIGSNKRTTLFNKNEPFNGRVIRMVKITSDFWQAYGSKLTGQNKNYVKNYASLVRHRNPLWNLRIVLKYPPARATTTGNLVFAGIVVRDYQKLSRLG